MKVDFKPLKRGQWRAQLENYKPVSSDQGEFKAEIWGQTIEGFTKHKRNGMSKVIEDTNGDGRLSKGDQLIAKGRVEKEYRCMVNPLKALEVGGVEQRLERQDWQNGLPGLGVSPVLEFTNSEGDTVAKFDLQWQFAPNWEGCPTCF